MFAQIHGKNDIKINNGTKGGWRNMKTLVGGAAAAVLGIIGMAVWWKPFLQLLAGAIPFALLSGGALAIYLGFDEMKDTWKSKEENMASDSEEVETYKQEVDQLKKEVEQLKGEKTTKKREEVNRFLTANNMKKFMSPCRETRAFYFRSSDGFVATRRYWPKSLFDSCNTSAAVTLSI